MPMPLRRCHSHQEGAIPGLTASEGLRITTCPRPLRQCHPHQEGAVPGFMASEGLRVATCPRPLRRCHPHQEGSVPGFTASEGLRVVTCPRPLRRCHPDQEDAVPGLTASEGLRVVTSPRPLRRCHPDQEDTVPRREATVSQHLHPCTRDAPHTPRPMCGHPRYSLQPSPDASWGPSLPPWEPLSCPCTALKPGVSIRKQERTSLTRFYFSFEVILKKIPQSTNQKVAR